MSEKPSSTRKEQKFSFDQRPWKDIYWESYSLIKTKQIEGHQAAHMIPIFFQRASWHLSSLVLWTLVYNFVKMVWVIRWIFKNNNACKFFNSNSKICKISGYIIFHELYINSFLMRSKGRTRFMCHHMITSTWVFCLTRKTGTLTPEFHLALLCFILPWRCTNTEQL